MKFTELKIKLIVATTIHGSNPDGQGQSESVSLLSQLWLIFGKSRSRKRVSVVESLYWLTGVAFLTLIKAGVMC